jgi:imidazolonepropionase-like amidohydrolase/ABC-type multidrug transport system permease subunit
MRPYLALLKLDLRLTLRNRPVLLFTWLLPLVSLFASADLFQVRTGRAAAYIVGMALTVGILGNGLWGAGMRPVREREANILRRFKLTSLGPLPILVASMASAWLTCLPVVALLLAVAHLVYAMPLPRNWMPLFLLATLGVCAFRAMGLILASVSNTVRGAIAATLLLYMAMLFLSGAVIPAATLPVWAQTAAQFLPASCLVSGFQGILFRDLGILDNALAALALTLTIAMGLLLPVKLFRWEKGEKLRWRNKLWVAAVMGPFLLIGCYQAHTGTHIAQNEALYRDLQRSGAFLIRDARIFVGDGRVIENGFVLVRDGKIAMMGEGAAPDPALLHADAVEGAGKTLLPGLIDAHVHLSAPAGISTSAQDYDSRMALPHAAAALLYSGVTAARSVGDGLEGSLALRREISSGSKLGAQIFVCGPMFTVEGGLRTQFLLHLPEMVRIAEEPQLVRMPKTPEEAHRQVRELKAAGVDCVKAILEAGWGEGMLNDRLDLLLVRSVSESAHAVGLPLAVHTGDARDVTDAVEIGAASVEHGAWRDEIPNGVLSRMARDGVYLDPTLGALEAYARYYSGNTEALDGPLVVQTVTPGILKGTRDFVGAGGSADAAKAEMFESAYEQAKDNLLRAWEAKVPLAMGTDAGTPMVFHGPSLHHELQLWVEAGIPAETALEAATLQAARLLGATNIGAVRPGWDADLLLVDGNPLEDISATTRISLVVFKGERIHRAELFQPK